jgi:hypothetical protein
VKVLVISRGGVNEGVRLADDETPLLEAVTRWAPDVRRGRTTWQDFGYKKAVVTESGWVYEVFDVPGKVES